MSLVGFFFYLFSILCVASAAAVILARNPVHAVLFLILAFFNAAGLFILLGAEFLALLLVIVYVGAVAVLFLFVVMMLDVDFAELRAGFIRNAPIGLMVAGVVLGELIALFVFRGLSVPKQSGGDATSADVVAGDPGGASAVAPVDVVAGRGEGQNVSNIEALGRVLYTEHVFLFQVAGLILLVAMVGAIVLTLRHKEGVKRQSISEQVARNPVEAVEVVRVPSGGAVIPSADGK